MQRSKTNSIVIQGAVLAGASIFVRLIGFFYRIPLINLIGDEGSGYYSNSFEIYAYLLILSAYAMPSAMSKIISTRMTEKRYKEAHAIFIAAMQLGVLTGLASSAFLWFGSDTIAKLIGSPNSAFAIKALSPAIFIFSVMAVLRGYFQGMKTMMPTAFSQIVEQIFNAVFSLIMAMLLIKKGVEFGAMGGTMGTGIGAFAGLLILIVTYFMARPTFIRRQLRDPHQLNHPGMFMYWRIILMTAVPMIIGAATYQLANLVDMVMFQRALIFHGASTEEVAVAYGILSGKYRTFIMLPISIASALVSASLPSITASVVLKDTENIIKKSNMAIRSTMLVVVPSAFGLAFLSRPILELVFRQENLDIASNLLRLGAVTVILYSFSTICIGILQGINQLQIPVKNAAIALVLKIVGNLIFLYMFNTHMYGAIITNILFAAIASWLNYQAILKHIHLRLDWMKTLIIPVIASTVMGAVSLSVHYGLGFLIPYEKLVTLIVLPLAMVIYGVALIKLKGINEEELLQMPKGQQLVRLLNKRSLL